MAKSSHSKLIVIKLVLMAILFVIIISGISLYVYPKSQRGSFYSPNVENNITSNAKEHYIRLADNYLDDDDLSKLYKIDNAEDFIITTLIISKKPGNTGISRDIRTEFTTDLLHSDRALTRCSFP